VRKDHCELLAELKNGSECGTKRATREKEYMSLFGQKTDTVKVDAIVNSYLRRLVDASVAPGTQDDTAEPQAAISHASLSPAWTRA
jgi:hypothetical protein